MKQPSVMGHSFSEIPNVDMHRSSFDRSHGLKTTFDGGFLVPILVDEALPGDSFSLNMSGFARLATPIKPVMDNLHMETFFFAVPYRLVWENWEKFNGAQDDPGDSTDFLIPQYNIQGAIENGTLADYMGLPTDITPGSIDFNILHFRAYQLVFNTWFRDQNLTNSVPIETGDGGDASGVLSLRRRSKRHDYFTSSLPWPQKGDNPVLLPLGDRAPIAAFLGNDLNAVDIGKLNNPDDHYSLDSSGVNVTYADQVGPPDLNDLLYADLSEATSATINELRQAFQIQRMFEKDARAGTRYIEVIKSHFGVTSDDARLNRPEFLGGGSSNITITPIPQTSETDPSGPDASPQANLAGYGTAVLSGHGFSKSFTEHCLILGLVNVRADLTYQAGLERMWTRQTRFDYYWPSLALIGEQIVKKEEIFYTGNIQDGDVWGYQERYAEYRYFPSKITGQFRSNYTASLDVWHLSQDFGTQPSLNNNFIQDDPPIDRIIAVPSEPHFLLDCHFSYRCARPMPTFGVPGLIDHF